MFGICIFTNKYMDDYYIFQVSELTHVILNVSNSILNVIKCNNTCRIIIQIIITLHVKILRELLLCYYVHNCRLHNYYSTMLYFTICE